MRIAKTEYEIGDVITVGPTDELPSVLENLKPGTKVADPSFEVRTVLNDVYVFSDHGPYPDGRYVILYVPEKDTIKEMAVLLDMIYAEREEATHIQRLEDIAEFIVEREKEAVEGASEILDRDDDVWMLDPATGLYRTIGMNDGSGFLTLDDVKKHFGPVRVK